MTARVGESQVDHCTDLVGEIITGEIPIEQRCYCFPVRCGNDKLIVVGALPFTPRRVVSAQHTAMQAFAGLP